MHQLFVQIHGKNKDYSPFVLGQIQSPLSLTTSTSFSASENHDKAAQGHWKHENNFNVQEINRA
jgi:hypothetical protein